MYFDNKLYDEDVNKVFSSSSSDSDPPRVLVKGSDVDWDGGSGGGILPDDSRELYVDGDSTTSGGDTELGTKGSPYKTVGAAV